MAINTPIDGFPGMALLSAAMRGLKSVALEWFGPVVAKGAAFLGLATVSNSFAMQPLIAEFNARLAGAPAVFLDVLGYVGADKAITFVLSAYIVRAGSKLLMGQTP